VEDELPDAIADKPPPVVETPKTERESVPAPSQGGA
jgi:hypothetical protein